MIRSMTGYGREQRIIDQREITVEIKSVNHRYYEFTARVPRIYGFIEEKLKSYIKDSISRGKVEVNVTINNLNGKEANINVDKLMAAGYINAFSMYRKLLKMKKRFGGMFAVLQKTHWQNLLKCVRKKENI